MQGGKWLKALRKNDKMLKKRKSCKVEKGV